MDQVILEPLQEDIKCHSISLMEILIGQYLDAPCVQEKHTVWPTSIACMWKFMIVVTVAILAQGTPHGPMRQRRPFVLAQLCKT